MNIHADLVILGASVLAMTIAPSAAVSAELKAKTVVLVHGAFADGSSWQKVIPLLEQKGLKVVAVQNPWTHWRMMSPLPSGRSGTRKVQVVLVGHSWGGVVITEAGTDAKVKSLVYVAAVAPDAGQSLVDVVSKYPEPAVQKTYVKDAEGYLKISDEGIDKFFAAGLSPDEKKLVAVVQGAFHVRTLTAPVSHAAWQEKPSFMVIATKDDVLPPQMEKDQAKAANAKSIELPSGHVAMLSHPKEVADLIIQAAE